MSTIETGDFKSDRTSRDFSMTATGTDAAKVPPPRRILGTTMYVLELAIIAAPKCDRNAVVAAKWSGARYHLTAWLSHLAGDFVGFIVRERKLRWTPVDPTNRDSSRYNPRRFS